MKNINKKMLILDIIVLIALGMMFFLFINKDNIVNKKNALNSILTKEESISNLTNDDLKYSLNRNDYPNDEAYSNFRLLTTKNIKPIFYRGASPVDNTFNRLEITNKLLKQNNIKYVINLTNNEETYLSFVNKYNLDGKYINTLYTNNNIYFAGLGINYDTQKFAEGLAKALIQVIDNEGPFYIHCQHGRDRTGMACFILESLAGASFSEMLNDYMKTYENYNFVNEKENKEKYELILKTRFKNMISYITRGEKIKDYFAYDYEKAVKEYLKFGGLTDTQINSLKMSIIE